MSSAVSSVGNCDWPEWFTWCWLTCSVTPPSDPWLGGDGERVTLTYRDAARWRQEVDIQLSYIDWTGSRDAAWKTRTEAPTEA